MMEIGDGDMAPFVICSDCANLLVVEHFGVPCSSCQIISGVEDGDLKIDEGDLRSAETTWEKGEGNCHCFTMITDRECFA